MTADAPVDKRTAWKIVGTVVVVATAISGLLYASMKEEVAFWKFADEVAANPAAFEGKRLNVGGYVMDGSIQKNALEYRFTIETRKPRPYATVKAYYRGLVPDTFKGGGEVVATGKFAPDGTLMAEQIMAKCPSKYEAKGPQLPVAKTPDPNGGPGTASAATSPAVPATP